MSDLIEGHRGMRISLIAEPWSLTSLREKLIKIDAEPSLPVSPAM